MRKNIYAAAVTAMIVVLAVSCYKDKGNYTYTRLDEMVIDTAGISGARILPRFDTLHIHPVVRYKGQVVDPAKNQFPELAFSWIAYPSSANRFNEEHSLDSTLNLDKMIDLVELNWDVLFTVTNKTTGVKAYARFAVSVTTSLTEGWMVMYEREGATDVGLIVNSRISKTLIAREQVVMDLYEAANGTHLSGKPNSLIYSIANLPNYRIYLQTDKEIVGVNHGNFLKTYGWGDSLFWTMPATKVPAFVSANEARKDLIINNNKLHLINYSTILTGSRRFDLGTGVANSALAPWTSSTVASAFTTVVYDQTGKRFLKMTSTGADLIPFTTAQAATAAFDVNNVGLRFLMSDMGWSYYEHSVMKDDATGKTYLLTSSFKGGESTTIGKGKYDMSACPDISSIEDITAGYTGEVFYYSAGTANTYLYKYSTGITTAVWTAPANEKVTCVQLQKYYSTNAALAAYYDPKNANKVLYIGTWNESTKEGKVYEMEVDPTSGAIKAGTEKSYGGFGKIKAMAWKPFLIF